MKKQKSYLIRTPLRGNLVSSNHGFSLIEILIYAALLGIFLYSLTNLFVASVDVRLETEANSGVEQDGRYLLNRFRYDITGADSINTPSTLGGTGSTLQLRKGATTYTYSLDVNSNLIVSNGTTQEQLNSTRSKVTAINFTRRGNLGGKNSISISISLESQVVENQGAQTRDYDITYAIR